MRDSISYSPYSQKTKCLRASVEKAFVVQNITVRKANLRGGALIKHEGIDYKLSMPDWMVMLLEEGRELTTSVSFQEHKDGNNYAVLNTKKLSINE